MIPQNNSNGFKSIVSGLGVLCISAFIPVPAWATVNFHWGTNSVKPTTAITSQEVVQFPSEIIESVKGDIVGVILSDSRFKILATALRATGLLETLKEQGPFTLFAPTDEAFNALPDGTLEMLMQPENRDKLTNLLRYHVIPGQVTSGDLTSGEVETAEGSSVNIDRESDSISVGEASVIDSDISASNGVIHVIDKVMVLPE